MSWDWDNGGTIIGTKKRFKPINLNKRDVLVIPIGTTIGLVWDSPRTMLGQQNA